jgi:FAD/FMN-containing dehydrogenase
MRKSMPTQHREDPTNDSTKEQQVIDNEYVTPEELAAELSRAGIVEVDASSRRRAEYSTDASNYRAIPNAVVFPQSIEDVAAALSVARNTGVALTARGAGTSIAGNAVGPGIVLDFSRHLNRIISLDPETSTAIVQPGVILSDLQLAAAPHGLRFGPDPPRRLAAQSAG